MAASPAEHHDLAPRRRAKCPTCSGEWAPAADDTPASSCGRGAASQSSAFGSPSSSTASSLASSSSAGPRWLYSLADRVKRHIGGSEPSTESSKFWRRVKTVQAERDFVFVIYPPRTIRRFLKFERALGEGGFGTVFRASATPKGLQRIPMLEDSRHYALKRIPLVKAVPTEVIDRSILHVSDQRLLEFIDAMQWPGHPNVVRLIAYIIERGSSVYEVIELLEGPDLFEFLVFRKETVPEPTAALLAKQMFSAINFLHAKAGVLHRDVKPENFGFATPLLDDVSEPLPALKLFDFGMGWVLPKVVTKETAHDLLRLPLGGTRIYLAPECWEGSCGPVSDVWSAGVVVFLLLSLQLPFGLSRSRDVQHSLQQPLEFPNDAWAGSSCATDFVSSLLQKDPEQRATTEEALNAHWLQGDHSPSAPARYSSNMALSASLRRAPREGLTSSMFHSFMGTSAWA